ncbi:hypothetical protein MTR_8g087800 [Medicago truncatula]|uniref:Uncharacterized protein n=1 Tax=Medicago truncatula TaxID=3880 RepID=G7L7Z0_MEDTR|nr:hypothetical protein MTR_8g087800 [Medicago truncatula]
MKVYKNIYRQTRDDKKRVARTRDKEKRFVVLMSFITSKTKRTKRERSTNFLLGSFRVKRLDPTCFGLFPWNYTELVNSSIRPAEFVESMGVYQEIVYECE